MHKGKINPIMLSTKALTMEVHSNKQKGNNNERKFEKYYFQKDMTSKLNKGWRSYVYLFVFIFGSFLCYLGGESFGIRFSYI